MENARHDYRWVSEIRGYHLPIVVEILLLTSDRTGECPYNMMPSLTSFVTE